MQRPIERVERRDTPEQCEGGENGRQTPTERLLRKTAEPVEEHDGEPERADDRHGEIRAHHLDVVQHEEGESAHRRDGRNQPGPYGIPDHHASQPRTRRLLARTLALRAGFSRLCLHDAIASTASDNRQQRRRWAGGGPGPLSSVVCRPDLWLGERSGADEAASFLVWDWCCCVGLRRCCGSDGRI